MEVHTHPHNHGKKSWKQYFWEFLMLFLAVFCGFLAENFREHLVERRQEKEYMHSLVEDLQTDTMNLNDEIPFSQGISERTERLVLFLNNEPLHKDSIVKLYQLTLQAGRVVSIDFEDRTSSQLKNSGTMRLIRNKQVVDSIRNYWSIIKVADDIRARLEMVKGKAGDIGVRLFNNKYIQSSNIQDPLQSDFFVLPEAKLINDDPKLLAEYANRCHSSQFVLNNYIINMKAAKEMATNLIKLIKQEYGLK